MDDVVKRLTDALLDRPPVSKAGVPPKKVEQVVRKARAIATAELEQVLCSPTYSATVSQLLTPAVDSWSVRFPDLSTLPRSKEQKQQLSICIATEDIVGPVRNGGIGTTYAALAEMLASEGYDTTILYLRGQEIETGTLEQWVDHYASLGVKFIPVPNYAQREGVQTGADRWMCAPYNMLRYLIDHPKDVVHVSEWRGSSYLCQLAKRQGLAFKDTLFIVKTSSPWMWNRLYGSHPLDRPEDLAKIHAERRSVELADMVIGGSLHLLQWMLSQGYRVPRKRTFVQPNFVGFDHLKPLMGQRNLPIGTRVPISEIVFFGRLEARKGILTFCQAVRRLIRQGVPLPPRISFMGKPGAKLPGRPNETILEFIAEVTRDWPTEVSVLTDFQQQQAIEYLLAEPRLAVMPSTIENSSMAVYEAAICGIPFVASSVGGTPELVRAEDRSQVLCDPHPIPLADKMREAIELGGFIAGPSFDNDRNVEVWKAFHSNLACGLRSHLSQRRVGVASAEQQPHSAAVCIYHVGDGQALQATLESLQAQETPPAEVLIAVDAPNANAVETVQAVAASSGLNCHVIESFDQDAGLSFNTLADHATADFLVFLWEGSILHPQAVRLLGSIAGRSGADLLNFFYRYIDPAAPHGRHPLKAHIIGSLSEHFFKTDLTAQPLYVRRKAFLDVGGFTSDYRVLGYDSEFLGKAQMSGLVCETALVELATVPALSQQWLSTMCYDESVSHFRAIRPQLANAPLVMRDLLLMAKGLSVRPPPRAKKAGPPKQEKAQSGLDRLLTALSAPETQVAAPKGRPQAIRARPGPPPQNLLQLFEKAMDDEGALELNLERAAQANAIPADPLEKDPLHPSRFDRRILYVRDGVIHGWIVDREDPAAPVVVEAISDGVIIARVTADRTLQLPARLSKPATEGHGFAISIFSSQSIAWRSRNRKIDLRVAGAKSFFSRNVEVWAPGLSLEASDYNGFCDPSTDRTVQGWVWSPQEPDRQFFVAIFIDDRFVARVRAEGFREDLISNGVGSGEYGFRLSLNQLLDERRGESHTVDVVVADNGLRLRRAPLLVEGNFVRPRDESGAANWTRKLFTRLRA